MRYCISYNSEHNISRRDEFQNPNACYLNFEKNCELKVHYVIIITQLKANEIIQKQI